MHGGGTQRLFAEKEINRNMVAELSEFNRNRSVKDIIINALETNEIWHKQWYLEQLLIVLGFDIEKIKKEENENGYDFEKGIPP